MDKNPKTDVVPLRDRPPPWTKLVPPDAVQKSLAFFGRADRAGAPRSPLNFRSSETLGGVVECMIKAMREIRPRTVRQLFALADQHMRWELKRPGLPPRPTGAGRVVPRLARRRSYSMDWCLPRPLR